MTVQSKDFADPQTGSSGKALRLKWKAKETLSLDTNKQWPGPHKSAFLPTATGCLWLLKPLETNFREPLFMEIVIISVPVDLLELLE